ncbi:hypothetical protein [Rubinisphaera margarita]|uniref:hypothetical protein n=1 Tax=Rubinisphaera margarita TaxID=2909586 RepID=UPI001EE98FF1|nr:hypothetical protein [Rubinisphaera margarita]MCG6158381.1 hypothetical protein [Rubinisphaera margarita]
MFAFTFKAEGLIMSRQRNIAACLSVLFMTLAGSSLAADAVPSDERRLERLILQVNERVAAEYGVLKPEPITKERVFEAIEVAIERIAESDKHDRREIVRALQRVLAEESLPDGYNFYLSPTSHGFKPEVLKEGELSKRRVTLSYYLSVPVAVGRVTTQPARLWSLSQRFTIVENEHDLGE